MGLLGFQRQNKDGVLLKEARERQRGLWQEILSGECIHWDAFGDKKKPKVVCIKQ